MGRCGMIIAGYPGVGKSEYCIRAVDIGFDLESSEFKKKEGWEKDYVAKAIDLAYRGWIVFVSTHKEVLDELDRVDSSHGVFASVVFPALDLKDWWIDKLRLRYNVSNDDGDYNAFMRARMHYDGDIKYITKLCDKHGATLTGVRINKKEYNFTKIIEGLKLIYLGENMNKIDTNSIPVSLVDNKIKDTYSASKSNFSGTVTDGKEHPDTNTIFWETDDNGNFTGSGYSIDSSGRRHYFGDAVYRPDKKDSEEFDLLGVLKSLNDRLDRIEKSLSGEDQYIWPEKQKRDREYMFQFFTELMEIWKEFPEMRFGQLLGNVIQDPASYYIEDDKLIETLKKYYSKLKEGEKC